MTKDILAVIGALTIAYHVVGFCLGVRDGLKTGLAKHRARQPGRLRLVWSADGEGK